MKIMLNIGSGGVQAPEDYRIGHQEIQVDLVPGVDVQADARCLPFEDESVDAVYSSHLIEHFAEHEVVLVLREWRRVLKPGGELFLHCPDVRAACEQVLRGGVDSVAYTAMNGAAIRAQDILFGWSSAILNGNELMRHKVAFDQPKLVQVINEAGFSEVYVARYPEAFELGARGVK